MSEKKSTRFPKGVSGNPKGRPPGAKNRTTELVIEMMSDNYKSVVQAVIDAAKGGDMQACRIVMERLAPPARERPVSIELPDSSTPEGIELAQSAILTAVGAGDLLPGEGATISTLIENRRRSIETVELEQRITALEGKPK